MDGTRGACSSRQPAHHSICPRQEEHGQNQDPERLLRHPGRDPVADVPRQEHEGDGRHAVADPRESHHPTEEESQGSRQIAGKKETDQRAAELVFGELLGCQMSTEWTVAAAAGLVARSKDGVVIIDLDGDGHEETGWNLFYMHVAADDRVPAGTFVDEGQRLGHPSCEGGYSTATHLHFARRYDGEWIPADGSCPLVLSGWRAHASVSYEGTMTRGEEVRTACECREDEFNGLIAQ